MIVQAIVIAQAMAWCITSKSKESVTLLKRLWPPTIATVTLFCLEGVNLNVDTVGKMLGENDLQHPTIHTSENIWCSGLRASNSCGC